MNNEHKDKVEQRIRFVAKHYREGAIDAEKAWRAFSEAKGIKHRFFLVRYWQAIAAAILVCVAISTWYVMENEREEWLVVTTVPGQTKNVFLPDSSMVVMAGSSVIKYDLNAFKKGNRAVEMEGKAFFQVMRDEDSPFFVSTVSTLVEVLGTSFQLNEKSNRTELYVKTGKVAFSIKDKDEKLILTEGEAAVYKENEDVLLEESGNNPNVLSWQTKELHFNDTPLQNVIRDLSEYYQVKIVNRLNNGSKHLTASFNDRPLDETLLIINQTLDVHLVVEPAN